MVTRRFAKVGVAALALTTSLAAPLRAEDERGRWSFSLGPGVVSTFDDIRSNAAVVISRETDPDVTEPDGDLSNDEVISSDRRSDDLLARQTKVEEKQRIEFSIAYGLTSWLSLQLDTGYYQGDIAPLDTFITTERWVMSGSNPENWESIPEQVSTPVTVGELTQIPVSLNAVARFRKDSPFNPFIGIGVGYMFNDLQQSQSFADLNQRILTGFSRVMSAPDDTQDSLINTQEIYAGFLVPEIQSTSGATAVLLYDQDCTEAAGSTTEAPRSDLSLVCTSGDPFQARLAALPTEPFVRARVDDGFLYQLSVGADYHFNERWSAYVAARYMVTDAQVEVKIEGNDPAGGPGTGGFFSIDEGTFRYIAETNPTPIGAAQSENRFLRVNPQPSSTGGATTCPTDSCREETLQERIQVQGGEIDLSAFTVGAGIKFTF